MTVDISDRLLVLRFRDLGRGAGETIHAHRQRIAVHDSCWWGWWAKGQESDPSEILAALELPRFVALYDCDRALVYLAECQEIFTSPRPSLAPDNQLTPSYYHDMRLRAWFRFSEIEEGESGDVTGRTCIYMPTNGDATLGWRVNDLDDLLNCRQSTMWLLSEKAKP
jgi:hypothetical protein